MLFLSTQGSNILSASSKALRTTAACAALFADSASISFKRSNRLLAVGRKHLTHELDSMETGHLWALVRSSTPSQANLSQSEPRHLSTPTPPGFGNPTRPRAVVVSLPGPPSGGGRADTHDSSLPILLARKIAGQKSWDRPCTAHRALRDEEKDALDIAFLRCRGKWPP